MCISLFHLITREPLSFRFVFYLETGNHFCVWACILLIKRKLLCVQICIHLMTWKQLLYLGLYFTENNFDFCLITRKQFYVQMCTSHKTRKQLSSLDTHFHLITSCIIYLISKTMFAFHQIKRKHIITWSMSYPHNFDSLAKQSSTNLLKHALPFHLMLALCIYNIWKH